MSHVHIYIYYLDPCLFRHDTETYWIFRGLTLGIAVLRWSPQHERLLPLPWFKKTRQSEKSALEEKGLRNQLETGSKVSEREIGFMTLLGIPLKAFLWPVTIAMLYQA